MRIHRLIGIPVVLACALLFSSWLEAQDQIPVAAPMTTDLAGATGGVAASSVFRVLIPSKGAGGTAFLHKSGKLITAAHVVKGANPKDIILLDSKGSQYVVSAIVSDPDLDLALLTPKQRLKVSTLEITTDDQFKVGMQVSTWGYPEGYSGLTPLLMSGYLSGQDVVVTENKKMVLRWVVNAAFNNGNSGGPLVDIEKGKIIGVVSSKLAPLPPEIESALIALKNTGSGLIYEGKKQDGTTVTMSEAQVLEKVLQHLRSQTQLVIGYAVLVGDLKSFLKTKGIEP